MALTNQHIFILGSAKFDGEYESSIFTLAKQLAKNHMVYYIDYPYTITDTVRFYKTEQFKVRKPHFRWNASGIIRTENANLKILILPILPSISFFPEGKLYRKLLVNNERIISNRIKKTIHLNQIKDFIYINSFNFHYPDIANYLKPKLTVYHCVDPLIINYDKKHGIISEKELVIKSDLVICTSKQLFLDKKELNNDTYFVPNAANLEFSSRALDDNLEIHSSIAQLSHPIVGYFGNIERRIDFDLLKEVIVGNADINFVFAGPVSKEFMPDWIDKMPNLHFIGRIAYELMPNVIKGFDVAIIPFKKDEVSATIFPLKLFEYLGAGKPVVSTNFNPDLKEFTEGTVSYCSDPNDFTQAIRSALIDSEEKKAQRVAVAAKNTWEHRSKEIEELLEIYLDMKR